MKFLLVGDFQGKFSVSLKRKIKSEEFDAIIAVGDYGGIDDWKPYLREMFRLSKEGKGYLSAEEYFGKNRLKRLIKKDELATMKVLRTLNSLDKPVIFIFGNNDDGWYRYPFQSGEKLKKGKIKFLKRLNNFIDINYRARKYSGISFGGLGGYMDVDINYSKKNDEDGKNYRRRIARIERTKARLDRIIRNKLDILVLHYPPKEVFDIIKDRKNPYNGKSVGIAMFKEAILKNRPKLVICGHMHEYQGRRRIGKSLIVNPGGAEDGKYAIVEWPSLKVKFIN